MPDTSPVYQPRKPKESQYYQCIEDNLENLEQVYDDQFAKKYVFFRPYIKQVIYRYLDCGILHISVIEDEDVIKKILKHLGLWDQKARPPPKTTGPPKIQEYKIDFSASQLPMSDKWLYVDPAYTEISPS